jgi:hypothetical protein
LGVLPATTVNSFFNQTMTNLLTQVCERCHAFVRFIRDSL